MPLTAYAGANIGRPASVKQMDWDSIGTLSVLDTTGVEIPTAEYGGVLFNFIPTAYVGNIVVEGTIDGTNWVPVTPAVVDPADAYYLAVGGNWQEIRVRNTDFTSGTCTVIAQRIPIDMVARSYVANSNG